MLVLVQAGSQSVVVLVRKLDALDQTCPPPAEHKPCSGQIQYQRYVITGGPFAYSPVCIHLTPAGIEWCRCHHAVCMARPYEEPHHSGRAES